MIVGLLITICGLHSSKNLPLPFFSSFSFVTEINWSKCQSVTIFYLLTNLLGYLYGRIQSPRPDVMPDRREGITRATGFVFACIDTQAS